MKQVIVIERFWSINGRGRGVALGAVRSTYCSRIVPTGGLQTLKPCRGNKQKFKDDFGIVSQNNRSC